MKALQDKVNTNAPDADFPFGDLRDDDGTGNGTPGDRELFSDSLQFFEKIMDEAGIVPNGLLDNDYNGWQLYEAFRKLTRPYKLYAAALTQTGSSAPTVTEHFNDFGNIVWTRTGAGIYKGTLVGAFAGKRSVVASLPTSNGAIFATAMTDDEISIFTYELDLGAGSATLLDGLLAQGYVEVKVFD